MDDRIRQVLDHIEANLSSALTLQELAAVACMSPSHFHRVFKQSTGRTPFQFIEEVKMEHAYRLLIAGDIRVHTLSLQLGYRDYETFSRAFKKRHFLAPDDLRAIAQKVKSTTQTDENGLIIKVFVVEDLNEMATALEEVSHGLRQLLVEKGYDATDLEQAKFLSIMPKEVAEGEELMLVKNKFVLEENHKIWRELIKQSANGND